MREEFRLMSPWSAAIGSIVLILLLSAAAFAAPKSASAYYSDAAFQYIENRLPTPRAAEKKRSGTAL